MTLKTFCNIMNRIRKLAAQNGDDDPCFSISLINGNIIRTSLKNYQIFDDFIEIEIPVDTTSFVPVENIVSITI